MKKKKIFCSDLALRTQPSLIGSSVLAIVAQLSLLQTVHAADAYQWWAIRVNAPSVHQNIFTNSNNGVSYTVDKPKGAGVTLAIVDTGVSGHHELNHGGRLLSGYDVFSSTGNGQNDLHGHGTHVAGIAAAGLEGTGIVGIAPEAKILPIRVLDAQGSGSGSGIDAGITWALKNTTRNTIYNMSLGGGSPFGLTSLQNIKTKGSIAVIAAGNEKKPEPAYPARYAADATVAGWAIVVGAVDSNNQLASFSNKAGSTANYYLVAPGVSIYSTFKGDSYTTWSGTSMATPIVSGAAAVVWSAWPYLTGNQVVNSLLWSATDLGATGVDTTYGWGLLNLQAAMAPIGSTCQPTSTNSCQTTTTGGKPKTRGFASPAAAGVASTETSAQVIGFDSVGRHFLFSAATLVRPSSINLASQLATQLASSGPAQQMTRAGVTYSFQGDASQGYDAFSLRQQAFNGYMMMFHGQAALPFGVSHDQWMAQGFAADTMKIPYLNLIDHPMGILYGRQTDSGWGWRMSFITSTPQMNALDSRRWQFDAGNNLSTGFSPVSAKSIIAEASKKWGALELVASWGQLTENGAYLGAVNTDFATVSRTQYSSLSAVYDMTSGWNLLGQINRGVSQGGVNSGDVGYSTSTQSTSLGVLKKSFMNERDQVSFAYSLPARVTQGQMQLAAAVDVNMETGQPIFGSVPVSLRPSGREKRLELLWSQPFRSGQFAVSAMRRYEPNHSADAPAENILGLRMQRYLD